MYWTPKRPEGHTVDMPRRVGALAAALAICAGLAGCTTGGSTTQTPKHGHVETLSGKPLPVETVQGKSTSRKATPTTITLPGTVGECVKLYDPALHRVTSENCKQ